MTKEILEELINKKFSTHFIAKELNTSQTNVRYWLKKFNLSPVGFIKIKPLVINNKKICTLCKENLDIDNFYKKPDGNYHTYCKVCLSKKVLDRQQMIKKLSVEYKGGKCSHCGYNKCLGALQFHHINPLDKDINWKTFKMKGFNEELKQELDKCILLCANCHAEEHNRLNNL